MRGTMVAPRIVAAEQGCRLMDLKIPTLDSSRIRSRLRGADPRRLDTSKLKPSFSMPSIEMPHLERPQLPPMPALDDAGRAVGDAGRAVGDAGRAAAEAVGNAGRAAVEGAGDAGRAAAEFASDAGRMAGSAVSDAGRMIGSALDSAGERLHDLRSSVTPQRNKSGIGRGVTAVAIAAILGALAAGAAFFLDPARGARRRAAIRRRLGAQAGIARIGVDTARDAAKRAGDRAAELVRIPIESARDMVGSRNGHSDNGRSSEDTVDTAVLVGTGAMGGIASFGESDSGIGNLANANPAPWEPSGETLAAETATGSEAAWSADDAGSGTSSSEKEQERARAEALGE